MPDLRLDEDTHDLYFENNDLVITTGESDSLRQRLKVKLYSFQGEWFLNTQEGVPYFESIFGKNRAKESIDTIFKRKIVEENEVEQLIDFKSVVDRTNRVYSMQFRVKAADEDTPIPIEIEL